MHPFGHLLLLSVQYGVPSVATDVGGVSVFLGTVRDFSRGRKVQKLVYEHYDGMAERVLEEIRQQALKDFDIIEVSLIHRVGEIHPGENIVLVVVGAEHRGEAFRACQWCIDTIKTTLPVWKKEITPEGESWVEQCA